MLSRSAERTRRPFKFFDLSFARKMENQTSQNYFSIHMVTRKLFFTTNQGNTKTCCNPCVLFYLSYCLGLRLYLRLSLMYLMTHVRWWKRQRELKFIIKYYKWIADNLFEAWKHIELKSYHLKIVFHIQIIIYLWFL